MRVALYPGSFDPITRGHMDIIERGLSIFDRVEVAVAVNVNKKPFFSDAERIAMLEELYADEPRVGVVQLSGLLVHFAQKHKFKTVLRGLRAVSDFEYEFQMASMNRRLTEDVDFVFLMTSEEHFFVSSSLVREVAINGGDISQFVPQIVVDRFTERLGTPSNGQI